MSALPEGPWLYRPNKHDDWGVVRLGADGPILAVARSGSFDVDEDKHRHERTDPYESIGKAIAEIPDMRKELDRLRAELAKRRWQPIETAPKDGTIFDVWLGDALKSDLEFYSLPGSRISHAWSWRNGKFRPFTGLSPMAVTIVQPTHWMPPPDPPKETEG